MKVHIRGGRLIDPASQLDAGQDLYIDGGKVIAVGAAPAGFSAERTIDASGQVVCPGLIDLQAHLREPGFTQKGTIRTESEAAAAGGVTTLCCPPTTQPILDTPAVARLIKNRAEQAGLVRVLPLGALTKSLEGEQLSNMVSLQEAGCVAFSNGRLPIPGNQTLVRCLEYAATYDLLLFIQPQDHELSRNGCAHDGQMATRLGLPGIPETAETLDIARYLLLAEQTGVRIHFGQLSSPRSVQMVCDARLRGARVSADTAIQHLLLTDAQLVNYDSRYHLLPPLRSDSDRAGLREALASAAIVAVCSDHQPHEAAAKDAPFSDSEPGMTGLQTLLPLSLALVEQGVITLSAMIERLTRGPADVLGLPLGRLSVGADADVCIFDAEASWQLTPENNRSLGMNTPYMQQPLKGRVSHTLLGGEVVYQAS